jgi:hypothetical protein
MARLRAELRLLFRDVIPITTKRLRNRFARSRQ